MVLIHGKVDYEGDNTSCFTLLVVSPDLVVVSCLVYKVADPLVAVMGLGHGNEVIRYLF